MTILPKKKPAQQKNEGENADPNTLGHSYHGDRHGHSQENRDRYNYSNRNSPPRWPSSGSREEKRPAHSTGSNFDEYDNVDSGPSHSKRRHRASPHRSIRKSHSHTHTSHNHRNNPSPSFPSPGTSQGGHSPTQERPTGQSSTNESQNEDQPQYNSEDEYDRPAEMWTPEEADEREKLFEKRLRKKGLTIKKMGEDGACLFRAVADQVYGDQEMHAGVRKLCMDYMAKNSDYFSQYVTEDFDKYIERKRCDHIHGNHIEMQALSEMYNRPIEVYHYGTEPMNIFHGSQKTDNEPIRLSYHRNVHYNSIVDPYKATIGVGLGLPSFTPGMSEKLYEIGSHTGVVDVTGKHADKTLVKEAIRVSEDLELEQAMLEDKLRATDWEATNEAIEEQIARESYLEWLRETEMRTQKKTRSATATSSSSLASEGASGTSPQCAGWSSPRCRGVGSMSSPKVEAATSEDKGSKSPEKMSSPKASCSGTRSTSYAQSAVESTSQNAGLSPEEFSLIESATFMNQLPPCVFGLSDWEDGDILARVLAESQQEYLDSLKRTATANKDSEASCS